MEDKEAQIAVAQETAAALAAESREQNGQSRSKQLLALLEESQRKIKDIQQEIQRRLEENAAKLAQAGEDTPQYHGLLENKKFYEKALAEARQLEANAGNKNIKPEKGQNQEPGLKDIVIKASLKTPPYQEKDKQQDARSIQKLRGLAPDGKIFLRHADTETLNLLKTDIAYNTSLSDIKKILGLRKGATVQQTANAQNTNQRNERQLPYQQRQRSKSLTRSRMRLKQKQR